MRDTQTPIRSNTMGTSAVTDVPMNTPIQVNPNSDIDNMNPQWILNEYGQTVLNPSYIPPQPPPTVAQQIQEATQNITDAIKDIVSPTSDAPKANYSNVKTDIKTLQGVKAGTIKNLTPTSTTTKKPNYLLYGVIGLGAVIILAGIFKK